MGIVKPSEKGEKCVGNFIANNNNIIYYVYDIYLYNIFIIYLYFNTNTF